MYRRMIVINKINNLLFLTVETLINGVSYEGTSCVCVYDFIFIKPNLASLTIIFRIVIINWWRILIYYTNSFNVFILLFGIVVLLHNIKILQLLLHITWIWMTGLRLVSNSYGFQQLRGKLL